MRKISIVLLSILSTGCATVPNEKTDNMQTVKYVVGTVALIAIAGAVGKSQHASKCKNNSAGFYQDHSTGKIYNC